MMINDRRSDLTQDLLLPTLLLTAMGGMAWAVRGCSGYGGTAGCVFAGVLWGAGWWYLAHDTCGPQRRRYHSAWIILAVTLGIGFSGARGWAQWPRFFEGRLFTNSSKGEFVAISPLYGFMWMFIAGVPWAGLGACLLAWCGSLREMRAWDWFLRIAFGVGGASLGQYLFDTYPQYFLPLYSAIESQYNDLEQNPTLKRLINDNRNAIVHLSYYLSFLLFEVYRRDWKNSILILTVGLLNGIGWALLQTWNWAPAIWPNANFNWWRCWESSGGLSIGFSFGIAYFLVNRPMPDGELAHVTARRSLAGPNFEWLIVFTSLTSYASLFLRPQTEGWSTYCLAIVQLFGLSYYLLHQRPSATSSEQPDQTRWSHLSFDHKWSAVLLTLANTVFLFLPRPLLARSGMLYLAIVSGLGICGYLWSRTRFDEQRTATTPAGGDINLERLGLYLGLLFGLGHSARSGLKGWFNIYLGNEDYWSRLLWTVMGPLLVLGVIAITLQILIRPEPTQRRGKLFPNSAAAIWLVLICQNLLGLLVTGPLSNWIEVQFCLYYLQLFLITAVIVTHERDRKQQRCESVQAMTKP